MQKLLENARRFIYRNARPLDTARYQYHFENGSREAVLQALAAYQNEDGGFGHALEQDAWNPHSWPIPTCTAVSILREIGMEDKDHPVIHRLLKYLVSGADFDGHVWACMVKTNNDYPHAPWWEMGSESTCHQDYNPGAGLAGFLIRYADKGSEAYDLGKRITEEAYQAYMIKDLLNDMHEAALYVQLLEDAKASRFESEIFDAHKLEEKLRRQVSHLITKDKQAWENSYICRPSQFFYQKDSVWYRDNQDWAEYECDFIRATQEVDGGWAIHWSWQAYPDEWSISKNWWRGTVAVNNLLYLKGMGKI